MYFSAFVCGAIVFFFMAFFVFLPMLVFAPAKFALSFTFGSLCTMASMNMLSGWKAGLEHMFSAERRLFTATYLGSMFATLYAALYMHSYLLSLGFSAVQVCLPFCSKTMESCGGYWHAVCGLLLLNWST